MLTGLLRRQIQIAQPNRRNSFLFVETCFRIGKRKTEPYRVGSSLVLYHPSPQQRFEIYKNILTLHIWYYMHTFMSREGPGHQYRDIIIFNAFTKLKPLLVVHTTTSSLSLFLHRHLLQNSPSLSGIPISSRILRGFTPRHIAFKLTWKGGTFLFVFFLSRVSCVFYSFWVSFFVRKWKVLNFR